MDSPKEVHLFSLDDDLRGVVSICHYILVVSSHPVEHWFQEHHLVLVIFLFYLVVYPMRDCIQLGRVSPWSMNEREIEL